MPETFSITEQRTATLDALTAYSETYLSYKHRNERTAGLDAKLAGEYRAVNEHMNYLLERYFSLTAGVELEAIPCETEVLAGIRHQEEDAAWQEYGQD